MSICPSRSPLTCPAQKVSGSEIYNNELPAGTRVDKTANQIIFPDGKLIVLSLDGRVTIPNADGTREVIVGTGGADDLKLPPSSYEEVEGEIVPNKRVVDPGYNLKFNSSGILIEYNGTAVTAFSVGFVSGDTSVWTNVED